MKHKNDIDHYMLCIHHRYMHVCFVVSLKVDHIK